MSVRPFDFRWQHSWLGDGSSANGACRSVGAAGILASQLNESSSPGTNRVVDVLVELAGGGSCLTQYLGCSWMR
jgi:hypothetical protein